jgi:ATP-binding cassette, subfamily B, bacterial
MLSWCTSDTRGFAGLRVAGRAAVFSQRPGVLCGSRLTTGPGYGAAVQLLWETSRPLTFAVALYAMAAAALPNLVLIAVGRLVGEIPSAAKEGLASPAGHRMIAAFAVTGGAYAAALLLGPVQSALISVVKWRLVYRTQDRLIAAVSGPAGIALWGARSVPGL